MKMLLVVVVGFVVEVEVAVVDVNEVEDVVVEVVVCVEVLKC
jgi:hypothetical protein